MTRRGGKEKERIEEKKIGRGKKGRDPISEFQNRGTALKIKALTFTDGLP